MSTKITSPPVPPTAAPSAVANNDRHKMVRERQFPPSQFQNVMMLIQDGRITGTLLLDLHQGGIRNIRLQEEQAIRLGDAPSGPNGGAPTTNNP